MVGIYPKTFVFSGWHPNCYCYTTSVMLSKKAFKGYLKTGYVDPSHYTKQLPKGATSWLNSHKDQISGWKSKPYFIKDNFDQNFKLKEKLSLVKPNQAKKSA